MITSTRIREIRLKLGLSMRAFAKELGISSSTFSYYEAGKRLPSIPTCYKIIAYSKKKGLNIELSWIRPNEG